MGVGGPTSPLYMKRSSASMSRWRTSRRITIGCWHGFACCATRKKQTNNENNHRPEKKLGILGQLRSNNPIIIIMKTLFIDPGDWAFCCSAKPHKVDRIRTTYKQMKNAWPHSKVVKSSRNDRNNKKNSSKHVSNSMEPKEP